MNKKYRNPFASSKEEIGKEDIPVDEDYVLRESIRRIILELVSVQFCKNN